MLTPDVILGAYRSARMHQCEVVSRLCKLATTADPSTFASQIPQRYLDEIRQLTEHITQPSELISLFGGTLSLRSEADVQEWHREQAEGRERYVAGLQAWKAYFEQQGPAG
jgi:hypothetical protein